MNSHSFSTHIEDTVRSQMGSLLDRVRQKSAPEDEEGNYEEKKRLNVRPGGSSNSYQPQTPHVDQSRTKRFEISYDNKNYIKSFVSQDRGVHKDAKEFPKKKWEVEFNNDGPVTDFPPYPAGLLINTQNVTTEWETPYDNNNYILSLLAGTGISNKKFNGTDFLYPEDVNERLGETRNPSDYLSRNDLDMSLEIHPDDESYTSPYGENEEIHVEGPISQKRRNTAIYRYGNVERNIHDYEESGARKRSLRSRSPKEDHLYRNSIDYENENTLNEMLASHYNQYGVEASAHDYDRRHSILSSGGAKKRVVPKMEGYSGELHDGMTSSASYHRSRRAPGRSRSPRSPKSPTGLGRARRPMQTSDVRARHLVSDVEEEPFIESGKNWNDSSDVRAQHLVSDVHEDESFIESGQNWNDSNDIRARHLDFDEHQDEAAHKYGSNWINRVDRTSDILEDHVDHPNDYGTTHRDSYQKHFEDEDGSEVLIKARERYSEIHHRAK